MTSDREIEYVVGPIEPRSSTPTEKCGACGTTAWKFDPPVTFEEAEQCGAVKPGTYSTQIPGGIPFCMSPKHGDDEKHLYLVEYVDRW